MEEKSFLDKYRSIGGFIDIGKQISSIAELKFYSRCDELDSFPPIL